MFKQAFEKVLQGQVATAATTFGELRGLLEEFAKLSKQALQKQVQATDVGLRQLLTDAQGGAGETSEDFRRALGARWEESGWTSYSARPSPARAPRVVRVGELACSKLPGWSIPALVPFVGEGHIMFRGSGASVDGATKCMQSVILRTIAALPPGKMRLTLIDPGMRGEAFAPLLCFSEVIRGAVVWDDRPKVIEQLDKIKSHISNVGQKYLRHEYSSLADFNEHAGEVAEPYRIVAIAGFPTGFSSEMANDVLTIAATGIRTGVHLIMTYDRSRPLPHGFPIAELERQCNVLEDDGAGRFRFTSTKTSWLDTLALDSVPPRQVLNTLASAVNPTAEKSDDIQISFSECLKRPPWNTCWSSDTLDGLSFPAGITGANHIVTFDLAGGTTTAPHALVAGKSGFGKSNLLHALILGLCHRYAPDELELYLVDMKEGVEFVQYTQLPHARVVAVESDREFAVSVLRGLRSEIERRGELFRHHGSDFKTYRTKTKQVLPRVVIVIDEFQLLFERSDPLKHDAKMLLTDLVRRGRSFGIHVVLASQSLMNVDFDPAALSQIGVRTALQLDETDSHVVLGKDNDAARYLIRKGEAIYNNRNGLPEYNVKFQVALLPDQARSEMLGSLKKLAEARSLAARPRVFEGNRPASITDNPAFASVERPSSPKQAQIVGEEALVFLGEPLSISPTHLSFGFVPQRRSHLLIVGQHEETAAAILLGLLASAQQCPFSIKLLNLPRIGSPSQKVVAAAAKQLSLAETGGRSDTARFIAETHAELLRRSACAPGELRLQLLILFGLQFAEDDLPRAGFGNRTDGSTTKMLSEIVRKGPDLGIHLAVWSSTYQSVSATLDKDSAEFDGRVALSGGDALSVFPDPRLREHIELPPYYGAYYDQEARRAPQKFRCYGDALQFLQRA